jgi:hypothetical protein
MTIGIMPCSNTPIKGRRSAGMINIKQTTSTTFLPIPFDRLICRTKKLNKKTTIRRSENPIRIN